MRMCRRAVMFEVVVAAQSALLAQDAGPSGEVRQSLDELGDAGASIWNAVGGFIGAWAGSEYAWVLGIAVGILIYRVFIRPLFSR
jgi:hypothetical protein